MRTTLLILLALALEMLAAGPLRAEVLEGRVVHPDGRDLEGVTVHLVTPKPEGGFDTKDVSAQEEGRFRFELERGATYGVYAEYQDVLFPAEIVSVPREPGPPLEPVELRVYERSTDTSAIQLFDPYTVLDRGEAGAYRVQQSIGIFNPTETVVFAPEGQAPLVRIGLVPDPLQVVARLGQQLAPAAVEIDGQLATYRGPIFPGSQALELTYEVDAGGPDLETELWFPAGAESFRLIVPDRRQAVYAEGLFPSAKTRNEPTGFQYFRGYDLAPGARLPLRIEEIPEPGGSPIAAALALAVLLFGLCIFVFLPVASAVRAAPAKPDDAQVTPGETLALALTDLEHDFEMGKISAEDREQLRAELRREALLEMARQESQPAPPEATPAAAFCSSCGQRAGAGARFCSACGTKL